MARFSENAKCWLVERGEAQWLAWRAWLMHEFKRGFFPPKLPVPAEWPPTTEAGAIAVVDYFRDLQTQIMRESERDKSKKWPHGFAELPAHPRPWIRWTPQQCARIVQQFAEAENPPDAIKPAPRTDNVLHMPKRQPSYTPGVDS